MAGAATPAQLAAFVVLLRAKGETPEELAGLVQTMLARATPVTVAGRAVDVVGTGADRAHTVNISTMAAIVVAGTGRRVVKHGNRAATSACGAADVLEQLGVAIDLPSEAVATTRGGGRHRLLLRAGVPRRDAPRQWPASRARACPTAFNFLGPLTNPARVPAAAVGCADAPDGAGDGPSTRRPRRHRSGVSRRRRSGRADHDHHVERVGRRRRRGDRGVARSGALRHRGGRAGGAARRRPGTQRRGGA